MGKYLICMRFGYSQQLWAMIDLPVLCDQQAYKPVTNWDMGIVVVCLLRHQAQLRMDWEDVSPTNQTLMDT